MADDAQTVMPTGSLRRGVKRVGWVGLLANILISALKFTVGILGRSQAVVADAVHSLSDVTTDLALLVGVGYWTAPADEGHPYGHWRIETIIALVIGGVVAVVGVGIGYHALVTIPDVSRTRPGWIALSGAVFSIVSKEILYRWTAREGRRLKSSAVMANAWHHRSDALSSIPVAITVVVAAGIEGWGFVDGVGAVLVAALILHAAWRIIRDALNVLTDGGASSTARDAITEISDGVNGVKSVHGLRARQVGPGLHVDLHVLVDGALSVREGHDIAGAVKHALQEKGPDVLDVVVHIEPESRETVLGS